MKNSGITLIELIVVISIIGILVVALGFSFQGWVGGYRIEVQTKEMYADLMNARARAMQRNRAHFADFPSATSYRIREDTNEDNNPDSLAGDTILPTFPKTVGYSLSVSLAGVGTTITFDSRGIVSPNGNISFTSPSGVTPDYDCIVLFSTRINMGKWNGAACVAK